MHPTCIKTATLIGIAIAAIASLPNASAQTHDIMSKLYDCKTIADDAARLECYDQGVGRLETAEKSGELMTIDRESVNQIKRESFGFNIPSLPKLKLFNRDKSNETAATKAEDMDDGTLTLTLKSHRIMANGRIKFYFVNGQVWEQTQTKRARKIRDGETTTLVIRPAAMGSYMAKINGKGTSLRVKRIK